VPRFQLRSYRCRRRVPAKEPDRFRTDGTRPDCRAAVHADDRPGFSRDGAEDDGM